MHEEIILKDKDEDEDTFEIEEENYFQIFSDTVREWNNKKLLKIISLISLLIIFTIIGAILGIVSFSKTK